MNLPSLRTMKKWIVILLLPLMGCNYNYYQGQKMEEEGRFEEAFQEYRKAYNNDLGNLSYKKAVDRTSEKALEDLLQRYDQYLFQGRYRVAYARLEQASTLMPNHPRVREEMQKWTRILVAGKLELNFESLKDQIPLADDMGMVVVINTPDPNFNLICEVDVQTNTFSAVDLIYQADIRYLMSYTINSIGVQLKQRNRPVPQLLKFVDFRRLEVTKISGGLMPTSQSLTPVEQGFPKEILAASKTDAWIPQPGIKAEVELQKDRIGVGQVPQIDYLPQLIYMNQQDRRVFLDFGVVHLEQKTRRGSWFYSRRVDQERGYLADLRKSILLNPFFQYREGAYPVVLKGK